MLYYDSDAPNTDRFVDDPRKKRKAKKAKADDGDKVMQASKWEDFGSDDDTISSDSGNNADPGNNDSESSASSDASSTMSESSGDEIDDEVPSL